MLSIDGIKDHVADGQPKLTQLVAASKPQEAV
jgi:hypothetical protein